MTHPDIFAGGLMLELDTADSASSIRAPVRSIAAIAVVSRSASLDPRSPPQHQNGASVKGGGKSIGPAA
jgi:hypothetical protein